MIKTLKNTKLYQSLNLAKETHHTYLFHSSDKELNNNIAITFAKSLICENKECCNTCLACQQFDNGSHADFILIDQPSIKVEDANKLIDKLTTKPISSRFKVFLILNAENINEIAQNKLLKSLEEPNPSNIFILTSSKSDKLLPTILSRLHKISVPKLTLEDKEVLSRELIENGIDLNKYLNLDLSLTDIINFESNNNYKNTLNAINYIFENLKSSQDIPKVATTLPDFDKTLFLPILEKVFLGCLNKQNIFNNPVYNLICETFNDKALIHCLPIIEDAYKKQMSNVNFSYILDNLLFNILKEKFLCKQ